MKLRLVTENHLLSTPVFCDPGDSAHETAAAGILSGEDVRAECAKHLSTASASDKSFPHTLDSLGRWSLLTYSFPSVLYWNFSTHSRILLSVGSVLYLSETSVAPSQLTQFWKIPRHRFLTTCPRHVSSRLLPSGEICKYATAPTTKKLGPSCCLGCCTEFGSSGGTYELSCIS
jgi:hypothetical protein